MLLFKHVYAPHGTPDSYISSRIVCLQLTDLSYYESPLIEIGTIPVVLTICSFFFNCLLIEQAELSSTVMPLCSTFSVNQTMCSESLISNFKCVLLNQFGFPNSVCVCLCLFTCRFGLWLGGLISHSCLSPL